MLSSVLAHQTRLGAGAGAWGRSSRDVSKVITNILGFRGNTSLGALMGSKLGQFQDKKGC